MTPVTRRTLLFSGLCASAQSQSLRVRARSDLVLIPAIVTDASNRIVPNLRSNNFRLFEDKREQTLASFTWEQSPVSLTLLWDASRSMSNSLAAVRAAILHLLASLDAPDEASLMVFGARTQHATPFAQPAYLRSVAQMVTPLDGTAVLDALALALRKARDSRNSNRAILLFTDAADRDSRYTWKDLRRLVRESDARIFAFMPRPWRSRDERDTALLEEIADDSGGRCYVMRDAKDQLDNLDVRSLYVLGYTPANNSRDGKYRRVSLKIEGVSEKLRASWRRGYYAPVE